MSTDAEWEKWGARDPYYGVLADPRFRAAALTDSTREEFFTLGRMHVEQVLASCTRYFGADFTPRRVLDFGCGVGRLLIPFARVADEVVGVDVSPSMLKEARRNCAQADLRQVRLVPSDDGLSQVNGEFDLVHSSIVLQHIPIERGLALFEALVQRVKPGGVGALHVAIAWEWYAQQHGVPPAPKPEPLRARRWFNAKPPVTPKGDTDPEMQMNFYNLSQLMFILQRAGVGLVHNELSDHSGVLCAFLYFRRPPATS